VRRKREIEEKKRGKERKKTEKRQAREEIDLAGKRGGYYGNVIVKSANQKSRKTSEKGRAESLRLI